MTTPPRDRAGRRLIRSRQAARALYVDFEGRRDENPVLLGVVYMDGERWVLRRFVFDARCAQVDEAVGGGCAAVPTAHALEWLLDLSDAEQRHVVSWSSHDRNLVRKLSGGRAFRWRNAIRTAKRWRRRARAAGLIEDPGGPNELRLHEQLIGYRRPAESRGVGDSIAYIRSVKSVTLAAEECWNLVLRHNLHDLVAMRDVVFTAVGLEPPSTP